MTSRFRLAFAGASLLALASATTVHAAQPAAATAAAATPADDSAQLGEIVVTARRRSESLQQVPQSVTAVTSDTLQKLNIQKLEDVTAVTPGLSLSSGNNGYTTAVTTRGVSFQSESAASPTVAFYLNDAPVESTVLFQSLFDVGQIEVLRGPQGTVRGISAPSGAITLTTHKPDLSDYGGYIDVTATDLQGRNVNGAVNLPIIKDVMALRVAGVIDQNDFDGVRSVTDPLRPKSTTSAIRTSLSFEPNDKFNALVTYLHLDRDLRSYTQAAGLGDGINGPAIDASDRLSVNDDSSTIHTHVDEVTLQLDSRLWGQHLSYVGAYAFQKISALEAVDRGNLIPDGEFYNLSLTSQQRTSQEIRLASDPAPGRFLDYTVGAFYQWVHNDVTADQPTALPGFFGSTLGTVNEAIQGNVHILSPSSTEETSVFGSLTAHFGENTELTAGGRQIVARNVRSTVLTLDLPFGLGTIPAGAPVRQQDVHRPFIYSVSASHHFSRDFLVYANTGTSWRDGPAVVGIVNANNDPTLAALSTTRPETSRSYEVGFKSTLLDGRARVNMALFRQTFHNLIIRTEPVEYLQATSAGSAGTPALFNFTTQVNAVIEGFDIDTALQVTHNWNITAAVSYADGRAENGSIPCNEAIPTGQYVAMCAYSGSTSRDPLWNATITSEYTHEVRDGVDGFLRGLFTYYPKNPRQSPGSGFIADNYSLLNLYAGLRSQDGAWEVSAFAKNAFKTDKQLSLDANPFTVSGAPITLNSGYYGVSYTPRREVGVNVRNAFGSR